MAILNSYVKLPEGTWNDGWYGYPSQTEIPVVLGILGHGIGHVNLHGAMTIPQYSDIIGSQLGNQDFLCWSQTIANAWNKHCRKKCETKPPCFPAFVLDLNHCLPMKLSFPPSETGLIGPGKNSNAKNALQSTLHALQDGKVEAPRRLPFCCQFATLFSGTWECEDRCKHLDSILHSTVTVNLFHQVDGPRTAGCINHKQKNALQMAVSKKGLKWW